MIEDTIIKRSSQIDSANNNIVRDDEVFGSEDQLDLVLIGDLLEPVTPQKRI